ncbi:MAG TPA: carboxypeptidase M32 [Solirubrobacterales bacterium]|nr:carboxypeptidase M32 [Solirubrobacterales bacterium]
MTLPELRDRLGEIHDLGRAAALLAWDERTMMPPGGAESRAQQLATLAKVRHEMFSEDRVGELIEEARGELDGAAEPGESIDADLIRVVARDWAKARRVPSSLRAEMASAAVTAERAWVDAKRDSDFAALLPHLERNFELAREFGRCYEGFPGFEHPYDPLLDEYEPETSTAQMRALLAELREGLVPLVAEATAGGPPVPDPFRGEFDADAQRALLREMLAELPFPEGSYRIDPTDHPFAISIGRDDVRLTTRYEPGDLAMALFSGLHEAGHGLYELGVDPALARTPLAKPRSLGLHESQSRLWENWVGRSRPYLERLLPRLAARFPERFGGMSANELYAAANRVERSLIRIEADELTYNLHILIRFELELGLFDGTIGLADLPQAWNARYRDYLGLEVPDDARGVLQDVHWAGGAFGYFPTYSLGNVIAGQLWEAAARDVGDLAERIGAGDLAPLGEWLREHVHRHGRRLGPAEVLERAGCGELSVEPLLGHLRERVAALA